MTEYQNPPFEMREARDALSAGLVRFEQQIRTIELSIVENPGLVFDLARAMIESTCHSVLSERRIEYSKNEKLPKLFKITTKNLPLLPSSLEGEKAAKDSLEKTLRGLNDAVRGVCELRNGYGFASHGFSGERSSLGEAQARLAAEAADTIIGFLHRAHRQERFVEALKYEDFEGFNETIDDEIGSINVYDAEFRASEVLFNMKRDSYLSYLAEFESNSDSEELQIEQTSFQI